MVPFCRRSRFVGDVCTDGSGRRCSTRGWLSVGWREKRKIWVQKFFWEKWIGFCVVMDDTGFLFLFLFFLLKTFTDYPEIVGICRPICFLDFIGKFLQSSQKLILR
jgi:hypothetical protein